MKKIIIPIWGLVMLCINTNAQEAEINQTDHCHSEGSNHLFSTAPIGVMGDHMHHKGSLMFSYRFMMMNMNGNLSGSNDIENSDVFSNFMVAPQSMNMGMHMLGGMYAISNKFTLIMMGSYISNRMDLQTQMGMDFKTRSNGFGDVKLSGLVKLINKPKHSVHSIIGLSIPTGNIDKRDNTPMMTNAQLAYPMQLGSGTWDPLLGVTYLGQSKIVFWGIQTKYKFRINRNPENYSLGNLFLATAWGAIKASEKFNFTIRTSYTQNGSINGADADLNPMMMPLFNTANSGNKQLDLLGGINFNLTEGLFKGLKIGIETGYPVYQNMIGIQMKRSLISRIGIQYVLNKHS